MPGINDCILSKTGGTNINDALLEYYIGQGAVTMNLNDAEYEFLVAKGASPGHINDMWREYLTGEGYVGSLADQKKQFWCGETFNGPPKVLGSIITDDYPNIIYVRWDRAMRASCDIKSQIAVLIDGSPAVADAVEFYHLDFRVMRIVLPSDFSPYATVTWAYDDSGACDLEQIMAPNTEADNQTYAVNNHRAKTARPVVDGSDLIVDGTDIIID